MADPTLSAKVAALESQLNSLRLQLRGSPGVSTGVAGAMNIRTLQLGFAAELTSTFDQATGYSWKRLRLEPPELLNPGVQPTGLNAFEVSGDETLQSGTRVWMEPSPDAVGYLFSVGIPGAGGQDPACKSFLSLPECATLEVVEAYGACACITTGQTASLTRSGAALASDDLLYGCPPGITDADCPNGAASKLNLVVAGFTGGSTGYNGNWTLSYTATPTPRWTQTRGGVTWFATVEAGGNATLRGDDGVSEPSYEDATVATCCESITLNLDDGGGSEDPPATLTLIPATACGNGPAYTPYLSLETDTCGDCLRLLWIPVAGSGAASIRWKTIECGVDGDGKRYAEFASASTLICTDDAEECGENYVVVRVTCDLCANPDYDGAGFYCVDGECTFLAEDPGNGVVITTGKFEAAEDCFCNPSDMPGTCLDVGHPDLPLEVCASLSLYSGSDNLGIDGLTVPLTFFYFVNGDGDGSYGYRWTGSYPVLPQGSCTQVEMIGMGFGGTVSVGVPSCTLSMFLGAGSFALFVEAACYGVELDPAVGTTSADIEFADANLVWEFATAMDAGQTVGGVQETTGSATGTKYDAILSPTTCDLSPPVASYNCVNGSCVEVYDGSGEYATEAECTTACEGGGGGGCAVEPGDTATLHIEDGGYAGDYNAIWAPFGPIQLKASFVIPSLGSSVSVVIPYPAVASTDESYMTVFLADYFGEITCDPFLGTYDDSALLLELDTTLPVTVD